MNSSELIAALADSIRTAYPTRHASLANRPGVVTCVVVPVGAEFDVSPNCDPYPLDLEAEVHIQSATNDAQGVQDLIGHIPAVAELIRGAGFVVQRWRSSSDGEVPTVVVTAEAYGDHG